MKTIKIRTSLDNEFDVESYDSFEMFGEKFHITESRENHLLYTVTHEETGFCLDFDSSGVENAKQDGIKYLNKKGKKKALKAIRKSKWIIWKRKNVPKINSFKRLITWMFYLIVIVTSIVGAIVIGVYIAGNLTITLK